MKVAWVRDQWEVVERDSGSGCVIVRAECIELADEFNVKHEKNRETKFWHD